MRKIRSRKLKKQKYMVIISSFLFLSIFSVGYAAFSTTISLNAKGNVHPAPTYTVNQLKETVGTCGNGEFIADPDETGRYVYRGADPCNYLSLNNETWRILSIETDNTLKVIREDSVGSVVFDPGRTTVINGITENGSDTGTRYSTTSTDFCYYSSNNYGCKVWGSKDTMRNSSGVLLKDASGDGSAKMQRVLTSATTYDLPNDEAYLNVYLNGGTYAEVPVAGWFDTWASTLPVSIKNKILADHSFNVGLLSNTSGQLTSLDIDQEKALTWKGRVGILTASEYVRASTNSECTGVYAYRNNSTCYNNGSSHNYLRKTYDQWLISPLSSSESRFVWYAYSTYLGNGNTVSTVPYATRPVLYLSSDVQLKGDGTSSSKFQIK